MRGWRPTPTATRPTPPSASRSHWATPSEQILNVLRQIQNDLFDAGADLSTPVVEKPEHPPLRITQSYIDRLEAWCDEFNEPLPALNSFVLPGGTPLSALAARGPHGRAPRRALGLAGGGGPSRQRQRAAGQVPQPALGSAVHSVAGRQPGRRRAVATRRMSACAKTIDVVPLALRPSGAAPAATDATPARTETRSAHRGPAPPRSRACVPGWCRAVRGPRSASVMMSNSSPRGDRRDTISRPRRLSRRSGHQRRLDSR